MNYAKLLHTDKPVVTGLIGLGDFGQSFLRQSRRIPGVTVAAVCDVAVDRARTLLEAVGIPREACPICEAVGPAQSALEAGQVPVVPDGALLAELALDVIVEASGDPEAGARHAVAAFTQGRHLVLVNKETACTVGPALFAQAQDAGLVYTMADGDQPSMIMDMLSWARTNGMDVICAGKAGEVDQRVEGSDEALWQIRTPTDPTFAATVAARSACIPQAQRVRVPDYAELAIVINESGLGFDTPRLHGPVLHYAEMAAALRQRTDGGLLDHPPVVEVCNLLAHPHAPSMAGGVFLVIRNPGADNWDLLARKRHLISPDGAHIFLFRPYHLLGLETGISVLAAARLGLPTSGDDIHHIVDMVGRAEIDLPAGHVLTMGRGQCITHVQPELTNALPVAPDHPIPYYVAAGQPLARPVAQGALLQLQDVRLDETTTLWQLYRDQDAMAA